MFRTWLSFRYLSTKASYLSFRSRPKRLSGYNLFLKTIWPSLRQLNPVLNCLQYAGNDFKQVASIAAKKWRAVDEHTKQLYANKAKDISVQREKQYSEYLSSLKIEEIMAAGRKTKDLHLRSKSNHLEAKVRQLKKPGQPRSAYILFCIEARHPNLKLTVYQQRAEEDKRRYHDDMIDWEMCMQQTGNSQILQEYFQETNSADNVKKHLAKRLTQCEESLGG
nr:transcription factor A, mitochondrial-like isoform X4 [Dermacentor andersoni]